MERTQAAAARGRVELGIFLAGLIVLGAVLFAVALYAAFTDDASRELRVGAFLVGVPAASGSLYLGLGSLYVWLRRGTDAALGRSSAGARDA